MSEPILFLDFDGVLHPGICMPSQWFSRMPLLEQALDGAHVRLIISSSWRLHHDYGALVRRFPAALRPMLGGTTGDAYIGRHARHCEITEWLARHAPATDTNWRALDDALFEFPKGCTELIYCDDIVGITDNEVIDIQRWLSGTASPQQN